MAEAWTASCDSERPRRAKQTLQVNATRTLRYPYKGNQTQLERLKVLKTKLTESWQLKHPLVLASMAGSAGGALARAVSEAGGLGMIGLGAADSAEWLNREAAIARQAKRFGVGIQIWTLQARPEMLDMTLAQKPFAVCLSFGDPAPFVEAVHAAGALLISQVQTAELAEQAIAAGADALVAQGTEAGGHTGSVGTLPLLQRVLQIGEPAGVPVIAAGGIASGAGIAGVLAMGADAVWIGTRFAATDESLTSNAAKRQIEAASEADTVHTRVFDIVQGLAWPEEFPGRALQNAFTEKWHGRENQLLDSLNEAAVEFEAAKQAGDQSKAATYAGQAAGLIQSTLPARTVVEQLMSDAQAILRQRFESLLSD